MQIAILALIAPLLLAAAPTISDLTVVNRATVAIAELYLSASDEDSWGDNRLPDNAVAPGQTTHLTQLHLRGCKFDMRAIYADGSVEDKRGLDACRTRQFTFDATAAITPRALDESRAVRNILITNHAPRAIVEIYVSSAASDDWGDDLLASHPIASGSKGTVKPEVSCVADLRIVFDNRSAEERRDLDICAHPALDIRPGWTTSEDEGVERYDHPA